MLDSVRDLTNQLKLKMMIINNFIPKDEAARLEQRAIWDEDVQIWRVSFLVSFLAFLCLCFYVYFHGEVRKRKSEGKVEIE
jgi:hypothetical protein